MADAARVLRDAVEHAVVDVVGVARAVALALAATGGGRAVDGADGGGAEAERREDGADGVLLFPGVSDREPMAGVPPVGLERMLRERRSERSEGSERPVSMSMSVSVPESAAGSVRRALS